ncbi:MAG: hypothetical protein R3F31_16330 [Verrucomicrobiales bacterium]
MTVNLLENGAFWVGTSSAASTGFARALWTYDCTLSSVVDRASLRTDHFGHVEIDGGNRPIFRSSFARIVWLPKPGICPSQARKTSHCIRGAFLPILRRMICFQPFFMCEARIGKRRPHQTGGQPFNVPYLVTYIVKGPEKQDVKGKDFSTTKVEVEIKRWTAEPLPWPLMTR